MMIMDDVEELIEQLKDKDWRVRSNAADELRHSNKGDARAVGPLIAELNNDGNGCVSARKALAKIGEPAVLPLIGALKEGNENARKWAAWALGEIRDKRAVKPLIGLLNDPYYDVRWHATVALGLIGDVTALEPLIEKLKGKDAVLRPTVAEALGNIGDAKAVVPLIGALKDTSVDVRDIAFDALVEIGEPAAVPLVEASRKPENACLRGTIAEILEEINTWAKEEQHDFGCRETGLFRTPKIPDDFKKAMLDKTPENARKGEGTRVKTRA